MKMEKITIDPNNMSEEELRTIINNLCNIRDRKHEETLLRMRMNDTILAAKKKGFTFIDKDFGFVREVDDFTLLDERA